MGPQKAFSFCNVSTLESSKIWTAPTLLVFPRPRRPGCQVSQGFGKDVWNFLSTYACFFCFHPVWYSAISTLFCFLFLLSHYLKIICKPFRIVRIWLHINLIIISSRYIFKQLYYIPFATDFFKNMPATFRSTICYNFLFSVCNKLCDLYKTTVTLLKKGHLLHFLIYYHLLI